MYLSAATSSLLDGYCCGGMWGILGGPCGCAAMSPTDKLDARTHDSAAVYCRGYP